MSDLRLRITSAFGLLVMIAVAWVFSSDRRRVPWRTIGAGLAIQLFLGALLLRTAPGRAFFVAMNDAISVFLDYTQAGVKFVFGALADTGFSFVVNVLPVVVFMGAIFFLVLTPAGLLARLFGHRPLVRPHGTTYWQSRPAGARRGAMDHQF